MASIAAAQAKLEAALAAVQLYAAECGNVGRVLDARLEDIAAKERALEQERCVFGTCSSLITLACGLQMRKGQKPRSRERKSEKFGSCLTSTELNLPIAGRDSRARSHLSRTRTRRPRM